MRNIEALKNSASVLTAEDIEELYITVDDAILLEVCQKGGIPIPEDLKGEEEYLEDREEEFVEEELADVICQKPKKPGFFRTLLAIVLALGSIADSGSGKGHHGRCNGDCENCPLYYGYRYGRWYYGKGHVRGCQFGGNRGGGK